MNAAAPITHDEAHTIYQRRADAHDRAFLDRVGALQETILADWCAAFAGDGADEKIERLTAERPLALEESFAAAVAAAEIEARP